MKPTASTSKTPSLDRRHPLAPYQSTYLVSLIREKDGVRTPVEKKIWNSSEPLTLGFPIRWIFENAEKSIRIRYISPKLNQVQNSAHIEIPIRSLKASNEFPLPLGQNGNQRLLVCIQERNALRPAFEMSGTSLSSDAPTSKLHVFTCMNKIVQRSGVMKDSFRAQYKNKDLFTVSRSNNQYFLEANAKGLVLVAKNVNEAGVPLAEGQKIELSQADLVNKKLSIGKVSWHFVPFRFAEVTDVTIPYRLPRLAWLEEEKALQKKSFAVITILFMFFTTLLMLLPKHKMEEVKDEVIPPQYTKLILNKALKRSATNKTAQSKAAQKAPPKKAAETKIVQSFRAKAVQNSVNKLLKGGMSRLLRQKTNLLTTAKTNIAAESLFQAKATPDKGMEKFDKLAETKSVNVAGIGGSANGKAGGVGYGSGENAAVDGQGDGLVDLDAEGYSIAEGLTRDEVGKVIHQHMSEIRYCYESAMVRNPSVQGKLVVDFSIDSRGIVRRNASTKESTLKDPRLDDCILRRLVTWKFPKPKGGVDVAVIYPFIFKPLGR